MSIGCSGCYAGSRTHGRVCLGIFAVIVIGRNYSELPTGAHVVGKALFGARNCVLVFVKELFDPACDKLADRRDFFGARASETPTPNNAARAPALRRVRILRLS
jgi:hypothetical protein